MSRSMIRPGGDESLANNSICKISSSGIDYYERFIQNNKNKNLAILAIIISAIAVFFSALSYFKN